MRILRVGSLGSLCVLERLCGRLGLGEGFTLPCLKPLDFLVVATLALEVVDIFSPSTNAAASAAYPANPATPWRRWWD